MFSLRDDLSQATFYNNYSRRKEDGTPETWEEAVARVMDMHRQKYADVMTPELAAMIDEVQEGYNEKLMGGSQRALQFGGDPILRHNMKMFNCSATAMDRASAFGEVFYVLLCGTGIGVSVQTQHNERLPLIASRLDKEVVYQIPDTIEGWATAVDVLMSSFFLGGGKFPEYEGKKIVFDYSLIRPKGSPISGGFKAPGPEPLRHSLEKIERLLEARIGSFGAPVELRPIDTYDIVMHISDAVLSGGVRRAAVLTMFSLDDEEMMNAKTGDWWKDNPQRARSNNSVMLKRDAITFEQFEKIVERTREFGEPGFLFVDDYDFLFNPCVEVNLYPFFDGESSIQGCNLTEINGAKCTSREQFYRACRLSGILGTLQAGYTDFKFVPDHVKKTFDREALLGCSVTGWMNNPDVLLDPETQRSGAEIINAVNEQVAKMIGINPSARTTCVKPSGNTSALFGTASNTGGEHAKRYIRNAQYNKQSDVAQLIESTNPAMVEESVWSATNTDVVVSYPIEVDEDNKFRSEIKGVKHLEIVKMIQENWVGTGRHVDRCVKPNLSHNVSNTITVDDWDAVTRYLYDNRQWFTGVSMLGESGDKDYAQAPFVEVLTEDQYRDKYGFDYTDVDGAELDGLSSRWFELGSDKNWLKDAYWLRKWKQIESTYKPIEWSKVQVHETDINETGAIACNANSCEFKI